MFVRELGSKTTELVSVAAGGISGNGSSYTGSGPLSADGRFVAFFSLASNLHVPDANGKSDVFVRDRRAGTTELVSAARARFLIRKRVTIAPAHPAPRGLSKITLTVANEDGPVAHASVRAWRGSAHARCGRAAVSFRSSTARCVWRVPLRSHQLRLRGSVSVIAASGRATRMFSTRVRCSRPPPRQLGAHGRRHLRAEQLDRAHASSRAASCRR